MVKVTLQEEGYKTIEHNCEYALVYMIKPQDSDSSDAGISMLGEVSVSEAVKAIGRCTMYVIDHMVAGDENAKKIALCTLVDEMIEEIKDKIDTNPAKEADVIPFPTKLSRT